MGLVRCPDCQKDVSSEAPHCPNCGRPIKAAPVQPPAQPQKKKSSSLLTCLVALIAIPIIGIIIITVIPLLINSPSRPSTTVAPAVQTPPKTPEQLAAEKAAEEKRIAAEKAEAEKLLKNRKAFIEKMHRTGMIQKIEMSLGDVPHVYARPLFFAQDFDFKQNMISVIYAYHNSLNPKVDLVVIHNSISGKRVGNFSTISGLSLDE